VTCRRIGWPSEATFSIAMKWSLTPRADDYFRLRQSFLPLEGSLPSGSAL
jgi:hypothetical protein